MLELCLLLIEDEQDKALFKDLYDKYNSLVFYIAKGHLNNHSLAEEATQEAFLYIAKHFDSFKGENENLKGYIATVARGTAISYYRKERRHLYNLNYEDVETWTATKTSSVFVGLSDSKIINPFSDYRIRVTFTADQESIVVFKYP